MPFARAFSFCHCEGIFLLSLREHFSSVIARSIFLLSLRGAFPSVIARAFFPVIARSGATKQSLLCRSCRDCRAPLRSARMTCQYASAGSLLYHCEGFFSHFEERFPVIPRALSCHCEERSGAISKLPRSTRNVTLIVNRKGRCTAPF